MQREEEGRKEEHEGNSSQTTKKKRKEDSDRFYPGICPRGENVCDFFRQGKLSGGFSQTFRLAKRVRNKTALGVMPGMRDTAPMAFWIQLVTEIEKRGGDESVGHRGLWAVHKRAFAVLQSKEQTCSSSQDPKGETNLPPF